MIFPFREMRDLGADSTVFDTVNDGGREKTSKEAWFRGGYNMPVRSKPGDEIRRFVLGGNHHASNDSAAIIRRTGRNAICFSLV
jgi:hypothetical protein